MYSSVELLMQVFIINHWGETQLWNESNI